MNNVERMTEMGSGKFMDKINKLTQPLLTHFGINYFCYQTVTDDGKWIWLGNKPEWLLGRSDSQFYLCDPTLMDPRKFRSCSFLANTHRDPEFQSTLLKHAVDNYDLSHCLAIVKRGQSGCEFFFYAAPCGNTNVYNTYITHFDMLNNGFINYFKTEMRSVLKNMNDDAVDLVQLKKERYFHANFPLMTDMSHELSQNFLRDIQHPTSQITLRERECLDLYKKGLTAKESAKLLNISPRTIEEHFENLKIKFRLANKRELLNIDL